MIFQIYINLNGLVWPGVPLPFNIQIPLKLDFYENLKIEKTRFHLKSNEFGYIRTGKSIVLKPGTYITYKDKNNPNVINSNCGVRLFTKRYNCTDNRGDYDDNTLNIRESYTHNYDNYFYGLDSLIAYKNHK